MHAAATAPTHDRTEVVQVVRRCFQIMQRHTEAVWREASDLIITPDLKSVEWNAFDAGPELVKAGEAAALAALPVITSWFANRVDDPALVT